MLDAFIIEQIRKRERAEAEDRPVLQLPLHEDRSPPPDSNKGSRPSQDDEGPRGVIVIDFA